MKFKFTHTVAEMMPRKRDGTSTGACRPRGRLVRLGEHERLRLGGGLGVGFGRIVVSETEAPNLVANPVWSGRAVAQRGSAACDRTLLVPERRGPR